MTKDSEKEHLKNYLYVCPPTKFLTGTSIFIINLSCLDSKILSVQITTEIILAKMFPLYQRVAKAAVLWSYGGSPCLKCRLQGSAPGRIRRIERIWRSSTGNLESAFLADRV